MVLHSMQNRGEQRLKKKRWRRHRLPRLHDSALYLMVWLQFCLGLLCFFHSCSNGNLEKQSCWWSIQSIWLLWWSRLSLSPKEFSFWHTWSMSDEFHQYAKFEIGELWSWHFNSGFWLSHCLVSRAILWQDTPPTTGLCRHFSFFVPFFLHKSPVI